MDQTDFSLSSESMTPYGGDGGDAMWGLGQSSPNIDHSAAEFGNEVSEPDVYSRTRRQMKADENVLKCHSPQRLI